VAFEQAAQAAVRISASTQIILTDVLAVALSPSKKIKRLYLKLGHFRRYTAWATDSVVKQDVRVELIASKQ
jgi:hypothetical protein